MKKLYLLAAMILCSPCIFAQTVFTYGKYPVSRDEFLRAYNKNSTPVTDKEKSIREYLELYSNFKLKVKAAEELRLDTLPQIQGDIASFRAQVQENYMNDEKGLNALMDEAFHRSQKDIHVVHFVIPVDPASAPEDTLKAYQKIFAVQQALAGGEKDNLTLAGKYNTRYSDLGFITVFSVPYEYENIIYGLRPGQVSKPYRSKNGWHVFKVTEERKSMGKWKVAQVLLVFPPNAEPVTKEVLKKKADSIYALLQGGYDFAKAAKEFSEDRLTYMTGGELPEFGAGKYDANFEAEVLKLRADGDIGKPFTSEYGVHILKRLSFTETPTQKENAALKFEHKQKILQDSRINNAKEKFSKEVLALIGYKRNEAVKDAELFRYADSARSQSGDMSRSYPISNKTIITFKNGSLKGSDWIKFIREYTGNTELYKGEQMPGLWKKFTQMSALDYYRNNLETYNPDFRFQMKEFKEGNMLFEIMERNVWSKAAGDTAGLKAYYSDNRDKYKWQASADVVMVSASDEKAAQDVMTAMKAGKSWRLLSDESNGLVQADSGRYELSQLADTGSSATPAENSYSPVIKNNDGSASFIFYTRVYPPNQQRSFEEARGLVINDYQSVLEKKWLATLHRKYPVKVNEQVVRQLIQ